MSACFSRILAMFTVYLPSSSRSVLAQRYLWHTAETMAPHMACNNNNNTGI